MLLWQSCYLRKLKELVAQFGYDVHLHDACGAQSFTLEPTAGNQSGQIYEKIEEFFAKHQMSVRFYDSEKLNFVVQ